MGAAYGGDRVSGSISATTSVIFVTRSIRPAAISGVAPSVYEAAALLAISLRFSADISAARAMSPMRPGGSILAVIGRQVVDVACGDLPIHDGSADDFTGAHFAFGASWHLFRNP